MFHADSGRAGFARSGVQRTITQRDGAQIDPNPKAEADLLEEVVSPPSVRESIARSPLLVNLILLVLGIAGWLLIDGVLLLGFGRVG